MMAGLPLTGTLRALLLICGTMLPVAVMAAQPILIARDPGCGCCSAWAAQVRRQFGRAVTITNDANRAALQRRLGIPAALSSCHTAIIDGYAFEGHVPIADMKRLLASKPRGVRGLAVAGMPIGSPGMEVPGRSADRYDVMAFGNGKPIVFARH